MPIEVTNNIIEEKNRISQPNPWLLCLTLTNVAGDLVIRLVQNNEDVTINGEVYQAFPFEIDPIPEVTKGSLPTLAVKVSNIDRQIQAYIEQDATLGSGWTVDLDLHYYDLDTQTTLPEISQTWKSLDITADKEYVTINLGMPNPMTSQFPKQKFTSNFCQRTFNDGVGCPYSTQGNGTGLTTCKKTIEECRERFSEARVNSTGERIGLPFLGFNGIEIRAIYRV